MVFPLNLTTDSPTCLYVWGVLDGGTTKKSDVTRSRVHLEWERSWYWIIWTGHHNWAFSLISAPVNSSWACDYLCTTTWNTQKIRANPIYYNFDVLGISRRSETLRHLLRNHSESINFNFSIFQFYIENHQCDSSFRFSQDNSPIIPINSFSVRYINFNLTKLLNCSNFMFYIEGIMITTRRITGKHLNFTLLVLFSSSTT